ncbi:MAG: cell surface protein [Planctomyces sp.]
MSQSASSSASGPSSSGSDGTLPATVETPSSGGTLPAAPNQPLATMRRYLDRAIGVLKKFGVSAAGDTSEELIRLLEDVRHVDEARVLAIADVIKHMSTFNRLVRENVENIRIGNRYLEITQMFDSVREDSKMLISQLADGKLSRSEKFQNWWMKIRRGTPSDRFETISDTYRSVSKDTKDQLDRENAIMDAYIDFRFALKEAEVVSSELYEKQKPTLEQARKSLAAAQTSVDGFQGDDSSKRGRLELARDEAREAFQKEDRTFQLLKDISENLSIGYDVGDTLVTKLKQTHDVKDSVYRRAVTFFTTNEHVFTILGTVYTSQQGLHEVTAATEAMKEGLNKGLEDVAELGRELERAAMKAGYGSTVKAESVQKLVDAISSFQVESLNMIAELRKESEQNAKDIRQVVEDGKRRFQETVGRYVQNSAAS